MSLSPLWSPHARTRLLSGLLASALLESNELRLLSHFRSVNSLDVPAISVHSSPQIRRMWLVEAESAKESMHSKLNMAVRAAPIAWIFTAWPGRSPGPFPRNKVMCFVGFWVVVLGNSVVDGRKGRAVEELMERAGKVEIEEMLEE